MKVVYTENEKLHIFESETGHVSTFLKERVTKKQAEEIAIQKMKDLNAHNLEQAVKIIAGSARSMGIEVKD